MGWMGWMGRWDDGMDGTMSACVCVCVRVCVWVCVCPSVCMCMCMRMCMCTHVHVFSFFSKRRVDTQRRRLPIPHIGGGRYPHSAAADTPHRRRPIPELSLTTDAQPSISHFRRSLTDGLSQKSNSFCHATAGDPFHRNFLSYTDRPGKGYTRQSLFLASV